jgi:hypothetical protein
MGQIESAHLAGRGCNQTTHHDGSACGAQNGVGDTAPDRPLSTCQSVRGHDNQVRVDTPGESIDEGRGCADRDLGIGGNTLIPQPSGDIVKLLSRHAYRLRLIEH